MHKNFQNTIAAARRGCADRVESEKNCLRFIRVDSPFRRGDEVLRFSCDCRKVLTAAAGMRVAFAAVFNGIFNL
jgi:hypothetical protein